MSFFDYEVGQISDRIFATLIDWALLLIYFYGISLIMGGATEIVDSNPVNVLIYAVLQIPVVFYDPLMEYFAKGQTIGKMVFKLRVLQFDGMLPSLGSVITRWMFTLIDFQLLAFIYGLLFAKGAGLLELIYIYLLLRLISPGIAIFFIAKNGKGQRIGDFFANTTVVKDKQRASLDDTVYRMIQDTYAPTYTNVLKLSDRDIRIIQDTLDNYRKTTNDKYVKELAHKAAKLLGISGGLKAVKFLETIIKDYNYLATKENNHQ